MTDTFKASIKEVLTVGNRIYKLQLNGESTTVKSSCATLSLDGYEDQKPYFSSLNPNNTVNVVIHNCSDFGDKTVYYVWQPRLPGMPHTCPRCKTRMDKTWGNNQI